MFHLHPRQVNLTSGCYGEDMIPLPTPIAFVSRTVLQIQVPDYLQDTVADIVGFIPAIVGALLILLIGWILGRILGGIVTRVLEGIGLSSYTRNTPVDRDGGIASAIGTLIAYIVYFYAALAAADVLGISMLSELFSEIGAFLPLIFSAAIVLVIGFIIGRTVGDLVAQIVDGFGFSTYARGTPLENITRSAGGIGNAIGSLVEYFIYFLTALAVADIVQIPALSELLNDFAAFIPALIGGILVLIVGVFLADRLEEIVANTDRSRLTSLAGLGVKLFVYYITITIALDTVGFATGVLTTFFTAAVTAFFGALGVALALGIGIGVGWGSKDYVAENIDRWVANARGSVSELNNEPDTGPNDEFDSSGPTDD